MSSLEDNSVKLNLLDRMHHSICTILAGIPAPEANICGHLPVISAAILLPVVNLFSTNPSVEDHIFLLQSW